MKFTEKHTKYACYIGYINQAVVNNLPPLLFVTFQRQFGVSLGQIGSLIFLNFFVQIFVDLLGAKYVDRIGYRFCSVLSHALTALGLVLMGVLPLCMTRFPFAGVLIAMVLNAIGGGLLEVLVSPIMESIPGEAKAADMSLLHSFYCWGHVSVVLLSTAFFLLFDAERWFLLPMFWALIPLFNLFLFAKVPLRVLVSDEERVPMKKLMRNRVFWLMLLLMLASGASEQSMSQWSSLFAESGLGVSKALGDLLGPCAFATCMGITRVFYGSRGASLRLRPALMGSAALCVCSYLLCVLSPIPILSLLGCGLCGFSVGLMWPGVFSLTSKYFAAGGTAMFAILALAGDVGCSVGPGLVGLVSGAVQDGAIPAITRLIHASSATEIGLKTGLFCAILFPVIILVCLLLLKKQRRKMKQADSAATQITR